jgi:MFS transporter, SHS family, lactate transporter
MECMTAGGEHQQILVDGKPTPNYAHVQGIFIGVVAVFVLFMTLIGPE